MNVTVNCRNVLHLIKPMLNVPFTNAMVVRFFSIMNRIKTDLSKQLSCQHLDIHLRGPDEGVDVDVFNPDPVIELWLSNRVRRLKFGPHKSSQHVKTRPSVNGIIQIQMNLLCQIQKTVTTSFKVFRLLQMYDIELSFHCAFVLLQSL